MKKIVTFLRSMNFAVFLLVLIIIMSAVGSLIPQDLPISDYASLYPKTFKPVIFLKLNRIFSSWYFISILAFLCFNMTLCSLGRIKSIYRQKANFAEDASRCAVNIGLTDNLRQNYAIISRRHDIESAK